MYKLLADIYSVATGDYLDHPPGGKCHVMMTACIRLAIAVLITCYKSKAQALTVR
jgi:hypothetical protein